MRDIIFYVIATGEIVGTQNYEDDVLTATITAELDAGEAYMDGVANDDLEYITFPGGVPTVTARPVISYDDDLYVLPNNTITVDLVLPTGTVITYDTDETTSVASEHFQFRSNGLEGTYEVYLDAPFPYISIMPLRIHCYAS